MAKRREKINLVPFATIILSWMLQLCATVLLSLSFHRYCHVCCRPYVSLVRSHIEPSSLSSLEYRTAQNITHQHSRRDALRCDLVRKTQSLLAGHSPRFYFEPRTEHVSHVTLALPPSGALEYSPEPPEYSKCWLKFYLAI